ncbi:MAG: c-type cytochrome domain-containing protein, partial [Gemmataceae bacterium]
MTSLFLPWLILPAAFGAPTAPIDDSFFESRVRPTLIQHCFECHGQKNTRGGLRVDSREALLKGGDSGPALIPGKATESLLIQAIHRADSKRAMPPKAPLPAQAIDDLVTWVNAGAPWPAYQPVPARKTPPASFTNPLAPNSQPLAPALQIWLKADGTPWKHGQPVHVWEDSSGRGHDLVATAGARTDGTGTPGTFVAKSDISGLPAVRFGPTTGLGGNAATAPAILGDAEFTLVLV